MNQPHDDSAEKIQRRAEQLQHARNHPPTSPLRGFGTFGMIGWTVATPTVGGALIGLWLDERIPQPFSWTLALLLGGIALGIFMAWGWMVRENRDHEPRDHRNS